MLILGNIYLALSSGLRQAYFSTLRSALQISVTCIETTCKKKKNMISAFHGNISNRYEVIFVKLFGVFVQRADVF